MAVVADGLLTSVLVTVLRRNTTGMKRMDTIVDLLILYAISTVYANSLLAALNSRKDLAERAAGGVFSDSLINVRATRALSYAGSVTFTLVSPTTFRPPASQYTRVSLVSARFADVPADSADGRIPVTLDV
ncbi:hypothetical protein TRAPUB_8353 [Trametes pubescens]|uniref:Uncharacterized protein n=1 Tax=Trametes pubescens TaxID=154538 RepID=A0A1M2W5K6_TRAPU|nr:hypothetical protein TRAPUB_8353 [Trametes pubescens]